MRMWTKIKTILNRLKQRKLNKSLDARVLNLFEAFRLASVLSQYVDVEKLNPDEDAVDFISDIVGKLSPDEYLACVSLLTHTDTDTIKKHISLDILTAFIEGLKLNHAVALLGFYKSLGL